MKKMSKNMVKPERTQTVLRLRVTYWISARRNTQKHVMIVAFDGNSGFLKALQCYVTCTLHLLLKK